MHKHIELCQFGRVQLGRSATREAKWMNKGRNEEGESWDRQEGRYYRYSLWRDPAQWYITEASLSICVQYSRRALLPSSFQEPLRTSQAHFANKTCSDLSLSYDRIACRKVQWKTYSPMNTYTQTRISHDLRLIEGKWKKKNTCGVFTIHNQWESKVNLGELIPKTIRTDQENPDIWVSELENTRWEKILFQE